MEPTCDALLRTWFESDLDAADAIGLCLRRWFHPDPAFDEGLRERFGALPDRALRGELAHWQAAPDTTLGLVIALDQLPRNLHRGTARAYAYDAAALETALRALDEGVDAALHPLEATFIYLPLEHAEDRALQDRSVALFGALAARVEGALAEPCASFVDFAKRHRDVVARFGRFPHRNAVLGRASTPEEIDYLEAGGETFG